MLDDAPPVPNWLQWLVGVAFPICFALWYGGRWFWKRSVSDWWAASSHARLERQIERIAAKYRRMRDINSDPRRISGFLARKGFIAIELTFLSVVISTIVIVSFVVIDDIQYVILVLYVPFIFIVMVSSVSMSIWRQLFIFEDFGSYEKGVSARLVRLLSSKRLGLDDAKIQTRMQHLLNSK